MTSKERVLAACKRQKTDRVPLDYLGRAALSQRLIRDLGLSSQEELMQRLHVDCRWLQPFFSNGLPSYDAEGKPQSVFGVKSEVRLLDNGTDFTEFTCRPLKDAETLDDILKHNWPGEKDVFIHDFSRQIEDYKDYAIITGPWTPIFCEAQYMRGDENLFIDMAVNPEIAKAIFDRIFGYYFAVAQKQFEAVKGKADIFFTGDDFGSQRGLLMSRDMWRAYFFSYYKRLFSLAKDFGLICMLHSCGAVSELYDLFIEAGVDVVDPVQVSASNMDVARLKNQYGDRVAFHGALDMQQLLPFADSDTVRKETLRIMDILGKDGGYIMCSTNEMLVDIPTENIIAAYDAQFA